MSRRRASKRALVWLSHTELGRRAISFVLREDPTLGLESLGRHLNRPAAFSNHSAWPRSIEGFHELAFLFSSNELNWGVALLRFDEAAYLYGVVRSLEPGTIAEIGRFKGGSTFLIAAAMDAESELYSYDLHVKLTAEFDGTELDRSLTQALERYDLSEKVHLVVADSRTVEPPGPCKLVFIDGDHSYAGVRADFENWRNAVEPSGHVLFHDAAAPPSGLGSHHEDVQRLVEEIERDKENAFVRVGGAGTIVHLRRQPF